MPLFLHFVLGIVEQNGVLQIQPPGARVEVVTGDQLPLVIDPHPFQVIAVIAVFPQAHNQLAGINIALQAAQETAQVDFVKIRQRTDNLERLIFRDVEVIGRLVTHDDLYLFPLAQQINDIAHQQGWQVEVRRAQRQFLIGAGHQVVDRFVQNALFTQAD
ncbi:hypothetical protein D3C78_1520190 [compost metagenome]